MPSVQEPPASAKPAPIARRSDRPDRAFRTRPDRESPHAPPLFARSADGA